MNLVAPYARSVGEKVPIRYFHLSESLVCNLTTLCYKELMRIGGHQETERLGKWMVYAAWILFLILLTVLFNNYLDKQHNPNTNIQISHNNSEIQEITLQRNRYGHYVTSGRINSKPVVFLLDTGATTISIPEGVARKLGLKKGVPHSVHTANGTITVYSTMLNSVAIGPIELRQLRAGVNPHMDGQEILLGMNFLKQIEMIQRGDQLILRRVSPVLSVPLADGNH